jgi:hypothetical protein
MEVGSECFVKTKAHTSLAASCRNGVPYSTWFLNQAADRFAKEGGKLHRAPDAAVRTWDAQRVLQKQLLLWFARTTARLGSRIDRDVQHVARLPARIKLVDTSPDSGHAVHMVGDGAFRCARCKRRRGSVVTFDAFGCRGGLGQGDPSTVAALAQPFVVSALRAKYVVGPVESAAAALAAVYQPTTGHVLMHAGSLFFCARCGCYAEHRFGSGLRTRCVAPTARGRQNLGRLRAHKHPLENRSLAVPHLVFAGAILEPIRELCSSDEECDSSDEAPGAAAGGPAEA